VEHVGGVEVEELPETRQGAKRRLLSLFIADPHQLFRECLARALGRAGRFDIIDRTESGTTLLEKFALHRADVLVLGTDVPDAELAGLIRGIVALFPAVKVLILGRAESNEQVVECLLAGAGGFLLRDRSLAEVVSAIEVVARGERVCPPGAMRLLFVRLGALGRERKRRERLDRLDLTPREMEILRLIADDLTNPEIAARLNLSVHTVKNHVHRILEALGVHSRWGAVNHAFAKGWLQERRRGV